MRVSLGDKTITAIATGSLAPPVPDVPVKDGDADTPVISSFRREGNLGLFKIGELRKGVPIEIPVTIENEEMVFFPQRSARHRAILKALWKG